MSDARGRARGALYGLAIGDALGMPTQMLPRRVVERRFGPLLEGFEPADGEHPVAAGLPAGSITDDTEQALILADHLCATGGRPRPAEIAAALLAWERESAARGRRDLLGPSTKRACEALARGEPVERAGIHGDTNGAAMRIAPVGIACAGDAGLIDVVEAASLATHNTTVALAGAAAVAAAVSAGVDGAGMAGAIEAGVEAAELGARRGHWVAGADVATRMRWATGAMNGGGEAAGIATIVSLVGTSVATQESVPAAFAVLALAPDEPWRACRLAASLGGDSDTIAAIAGAVAGAVHGVEALPAEAVALVDEVNDLDLARVADRVLGLRERRA